MYNINNLLRFFQRGNNSLKCVFAMVAMMFFGVSAWADQATISVSEETSCTDLLAGQTILAGKVCFTIENNDTVIVTYITENGWELEEAHLWIGNTLDGYPMTPKGNPKIGNFPYNSGNIAGATEFSFTVPLGSILDLDFDNLDQYCPDGLSSSIYALAHASLRKEDGSGGYQTETGWGDGQRVVQRGNWATRTSVIIEVVCEDQPPPPQMGQETAIMFGSIQLDSMEAECGSDTPARWGWQEGPLLEGNYVRAIYAAAGNNILANGTHIGDVLIDVNSGQVVVTIDLFEGFEAEETHIYIGTDPICSAAFGKDWNSDSNVLLDTSNGVYVGVHLSVEAECQSNGNFCSE